MAFVFCTNKWLVLTNKTPIIGILEQADSQNVSQYICVNVV